MKEKPKYSYRRHLGRFNIYRAEPNQWSTRIDSVRTEEEARRKVYELNGWKYKPKTIDHKS